MKFNKMLDDINKKYETELILDDVSFFKLENILEINLLALELEVRDHIIEDIMQKLENMPVFIELNIIVLEEILNELNEKFTSIKTELKDNELIISLNNISEVSLYETNIHFNQYKEKLEKLNIKIKFVEAELSENQLLDIEKRLEEKEFQLQEQIQNSQIKSKEKEVKVEQMEKGAFEYGSIKTAPKIMSSIDSLTEDGSRVSIKGQIFELNYRKITNSTIVSFDIDDGYEALRCKLFVNDKKFRAFEESVKNGMGVIVNGSYRYDDYERAMVLNVSGIEEIVLPVKTDTSPDKRIEMNIHTKASNLESIVEISELFERLKNYGHEAVGITDLFNVQAYPEINKFAKKYDIKVNYGMQANLSEDYPSILVNHYDLEVEDKDFVVFDIETTGLSNLTDKIIEFGAVKIRDGKIIDIFEEFVNPQEPLSDFTTELTGITNNMVSNAETIDKVLPRFLEFAKDTILVAHNAEFDVPFVIAKANDLNLEFKPAYMDTLYISRALHPEFKNHRLNTLAKNYQVSLLNHHRASDDAKATADIFLHMLREIEELGSKIDKHVNKIPTQMPKGENKEYQNIIFAKNYIGLKNLYTLVTKSNLNYFYREPRIPYQVYEDHKEGLLIGTGNYKSKLFNLTALKYEDHILSEEIKKFDFLGILPLDFTDHLINRSYIKDMDHFIEINKKMIDLAKENKIPILAIGDVYYLDKKDYPYRNIIKNYPRKRSLEDSGAFYFKTTNEMLDQYDYLDEETKRELVIEGPKKLNDMIEKISPIASGTFPPKIKDAEKQLRDTSFEKARSIYGEDLPEIVEERLNKELDSIISNGYATLYMIAKLLVEKSIDDGYLVGSRGSVGSSFAATMADITEVNPLPPHYVCGSCKYTEFVKSDEYTTGVDLPDKNCPVCNEKLNKDGFDIPFETFLGFEGDKEPDIDLNFASVYQSKTHKYTESLFGKGKVFRAGTLSTVAEKTAAGMALKFKEFYPDYDLIKTDYANINRVKRKIVGVKRSTGQHAGGLIVVPEEKDIEDFTPVQYPADKKESGIITTHFDYHAIEENLLKLDLLGHNSPTVIRLLSDMSKINAVNVDLSDPDTMSIFSSTEKLNIEHDYTNINNGSLGIPEFGTYFVRTMLDDTKPTTFDELIRISGLSHGTDVWLGNAQELVKAGTATLKSAICTRDDIMNYLIDKGLESKLAFIIMEQVRKGRGLTEEQIAEMKNNNVPQWYIDSCLKIKYMFPKAHAAAYVMMSYRIAYFKVHYPAYFYAVSFTNEISDFKFAEIKQGLDYLTVFIKQLKQEPGFVDNVFYTYELAEEMYARGIKFADIDLYESHPTNFEVIDESTIRPPLMAIDNVSEAIALDIAKAREKGKFISKEDFKQRTITNKTAMASIEDLGLFEGMQETNQIDFFSI
ncbi:PolC-type DNA polymerase III [uncultured Helcococcus sp.]|uniref:PolC-type DNA polymerase III n=1 Tax=uncultured Helcococcus sp. TaxID=1072508 RepID=UPI00263537B8|nr:PolC-type DNA polymerase III [uncultured Helcococcus sp.]